MLVDINQPSLGLVMLLLAFVIGFPVGDVGDDRGLIVELTAFRLLGFSVECVGDASDRCTCLLDDSSCGERILFLAEGLGTSPFPFLAIGVVVSPGCNEATALSMALGVDDSPSNVEFWMLFLDGFAYLLDGVDEDVSMVIKRMGGAVMSTNALVVVSWLMLKSFVVG